MLIAFLEQEGVVLEAAAPYRHEGNGVVESSMGTVSRAMLVLGAAPEPEFMFARHLQ